MKQKNNLTDPKPLYSNKQLSRVGLKNDMDQPGYCVCLACKTNIKTKSGFGFEWWFCPNGCNKEIHPLNTPFRNKSLRQATRPELLEVAEKAEIEADNLLKASKKTVTVQRQRKVGQNGI